MVLIDRFKPQFEQGTHCVWLRVTVWYHGSRVSVVQGWAL